MSEMSKNEKMARKDPLVQRLSADLGSRLLEVRTSEGLSQTTLAEMVGTKHPRISNLEGGLVDVRLSDIVKLARALDVNPGELLDLAAYKLEDYPLPLPTTTRVCRRPKRGRPSGALVSIEPSRGFALATRA